MNNFSPTVLDHFRMPRHSLPIEHPTATGWAGDLAKYRYMRIQIVVENDAVVEASFGTFGCVVAIAAGSLVCDWGVGRTLREARAVTVESIEHELGRLPPQRRFCVPLAVEAWNNAVAAAQSEVGHDG